MKPALCQDPAARGACFELLQELCLESLENFNTLMVLIQRLHLSDQEA
jgi:hypothetical protein